MIYGQNSKNRNVSVLANHLLMVIYIKSIWYKDCQQNYAKTIGKITTKISYRNGPRKYTMQFVAN